MAFIRNSDSAGHHERGIALVLSLVFLLVMMILGATAARVSTMQERMAGNLRESTEAFQSAEATLREIEQRLRQVAQTGSGGLGNIPLWTDFNIAASDCTLQEQGRVVWNDWQDAPWRSAPSTGNDYLVVSIPAAVVDAGGNIFQPPCLPLAEAGATPADRFFLVAARATGPAGTGEAVVQSIFLWPE